jgi:hypothetical protein
MSAYSSHTDFDKYHAKTGETCNYAEMKTEMFSGLSFAENPKAFEVSDLDIDASWLDFGGFFDGIGDFFGGIFEGV